MFLYWMLFVLFYWVVLSWSQMPWYGFVAFWAAFFMTGWVLGQRRQAHHG